MSAPPCDDLPSGRSAGALVRGDLAALPYVARDMIGRAALAGLGAYAFGVRGPALVRGAVGAAVGIEVFVLAYSAAREG